MSARKSKSGGKDSSKRRRRDEAADGDAADDHEYKIERVLAKRLMEGTEDTFEYQIKWVGYPEEENTWQPEDTLEPYKYWLAEFNRAEEFKMELEELKRATMAADSVAPPPPPSEPAPTEEPSGFGVSSGTAIGTTGGGGQERMEDMVLVKVKTEPGLEEEEADNFDAGYALDFADMGQGQDHEGHVVLASVSQATLQQRNQAMKLKLEEKDHEIAVLRKESLAVKLRNCVMESKLDKQSKELDVLNVEVLQLKGNLLQSNGKVATLSRELAKARTVSGSVGFEEMKKDLLRKDGLVAQLMQDLSVARNQLEQMELMGKSLAKKDAQIASVKQGLKDVEKENERLTRSLSGARELVLKLQNELEDARMSNEQIKMNLLNKEGMLVGLQRELKLKKEELDAQIGKLKKIQREAQRRDDKKLVMHSALEQAQSQISDLTERQSHLQGQLSAMQSENDQLRDNLSLNTVRMQSYMKENNTLMKMCKEMMPVIKNNTASPSKLLVGPVQMGESNQVNLDVSWNPVSDLEVSSSSTSSNSKNSEKDKAVESRSKMDAWQNNRGRIVIKPNWGTQQLKGKSASLEKLPPVRTQLGAGVEEGRQRGLAAGDPRGNPQNQRQGQGPSMMSLLGGFNGANWAKK